MAPPAHGSASGGSLAVADSDPPTELFSPFGMLGPWQTLASVGAPPTNLGKGVRRACSCVRPRPGI
eukprot:7269106-Alexandrium_andersonii.AAC.1